MEWLDQLWPWMHIGGRVLFALCFTVLTTGHFTQLAGLSGYAASKKVPAPKMAVLGSAAMAWVGSILIALGYHRYIGAGLVVLFLLPVTFMMHNYWTVTDPTGRMIDRIMFWKNLGLMGGALFMACYAGSAWPYSLGG
ncbi:MAG: DoxX family protein [Gemmatimonadetes bacterium]|nr:DoxX family protein [Gemmatimonadota bacterium]